MFEAIKKYQDVGLCGKPPAAWSFRPPEWWTELKMLYHQSCLWGTDETLSLPDYVSESSPLRVKQTRNKSLNVRGKDLRGHPAPLDWGKVLLRRLFTFNCFEWRFFPTWIIKSQRTRQDVCTRLMLPKEKLTGLWLLSTHRGRGWNEIYVGSQRAVVA